MHGSERARALESVRECTTSTRVPFGVVDSLVEKRSSVVVVVPVGLAAGLAAAAFRSAKPQCLAVERGAEQSREERR